MVQGRGSVCQAMTIAVSLLLLLVRCDIVHAATFTVGDTGGWSFNMDTWPNGKSFKAGDILVFNYSPAFHNVVVVDENGYDTCITPQGANVFQTGKDQITLAAGQNYFICNFPQHYESAMKIAVTAA